MELSDRMKKYESKYRSALFLPSNDEIMIIRVDGRAFHTYTKEAKYPFDPELHAAMDQVGIALCNEIQGAVMAYVQSDEVSIVVQARRNERSSPWFEGNVQKIASITASVASTTLSFLSHRVFGRYKVAQFDSRTFVLPRNEVSNYLIWRQTDAIRNSVQMQARAFFSHKQLTDKSCEKMKEMLNDIGQRWEDLPIGCQRGRAVIKQMRTGLVSFVDKRTGEELATQATRSEWVVDKNVPLFVENRGYVTERFAFDKENA